MKNCSIVKRIVIFAAFKTKNKDIFGFAAIFMPAAKIIGYCLLVGCCFLKVSTVLGRTYEGDSLFYTLIFQHEMTKNVKNCSRAKYSNMQATLTERKTVSIEAFNIEKNAKNKAYYFILSNGLLNQFSIFCQNYYSDNPHMDCIEYLLLKIQQS